MTCFSYDGCSPVPVCRMALLTEQRMSMASKLLQDAPKKFCQVPLVQEHILIIWFLSVIAFTHCTNCYHCIAEHEVSFTFSLYDRGYLISKSPVVSSPIWELLWWNSVTIVLGILFIKLEGNLVNFAYTCLFNWHICFQMDPGQTSIQDGKTLHPYDRASEKLFSVSVVSPVCRLVLRWEKFKLKEMLS